MLRILLENDLVPSMIIRVVSNVGETSNVIPDDLLEEGKQLLAESRYSPLTD